MASFRRTSRVTNRRSSTTHWLRGLCWRIPLDSGHLVAGSPATVRSYYVQQAQRGIATYIMLMTPFGDMTQDETMYTLDAFIEDVIPAVREVEPAAAHIRV